MNLPTSTDTHPDGTTFSEFSPMGPPMVNSDGNAYLEYEVRQIAYPPKITSAVLYLLQIAPDNSTTTIMLSSTTQDENLMPGRIIPDGNGGVLATWTISPSSGPVPQFPYQAADVVGGAVGAPYNLPFSPPSVTAGDYPTLVLGENGTAFATGTTTTTDGTNQPVSQLASFNIADGTPTWTYQAPVGSQLTIMAATSDEGVSVNDSRNGIMTFDAIGNPSQVAGNLGGIPKFSWGGNWFVQGSQGASSLILPLDVDAAGIWVTIGGNPSQNELPGALCACLSQSFDAEENMEQLSTGAGSQIDSKIAIQADSPSNCPICALPSPNPSAVPPILTSCTVLTGTGSTYLLLVGDHGLPGTNGRLGHDVGDSFNLAAQQKANDLQSEGNKVIACRISSIEDFNNALIGNGFIDGDVYYFGHSGLAGFRNDSGVIVAVASLLFIGQNPGLDTNIGAYNVNQLCNLSNGCNINNFLRAHTAIRINGCQAGETVLDGYSQRETSIAQMLSNQLNRGVYAYEVGMYFSSVDADHDSFVTGTGRKAPATLPVYMVPEGRPGHKPGPIGFTSH